MIEIVNMLNKKYTEKRLEENKPEFLTLIIFE